ncbi:plant seed peroxygenase [Ranunculus cassubicifolius]
MEVDSRKKLDSMATVSSDLPVTARRTIRSDLETFIPKPYMARAFVCPSTEHPHGTPPLKHPEKTVLQRHVAFFDWDDDGIIYAWDIYRGLRLLGFNMIVAFFSCILVTTLFSYPSMPGYIPSLFFPIHVKNIHQTLHGSDSGTYDSEGRFVPVNFENMFSKYAHTVKDKFTLRELWQLSEGNRSIYDFVGRWFSEQRRYQKLL